MPKQTSQPAQLPSIARLRELFELREGVLVNRTDRCGRSRAGSVAGGPRADGYWRVCVDYHRILLHRVVFALAYGRWPELDVDHINGDPGDNRVENLREATHAQNMRNGRRRKNNTSGSPGVSWNTKRGQWEVIIRCGGYTHHFGRHDDLEFADLVAHEARRRLFGEFAPARN